MSKKIQLTLLKGTNSKYNNTYILQNCSIVSIQKPSKERIELDDWMDSIRYEKNSALLAYF